MGDYLASLERLLAGDDRTYWPTHGASIRDPGPFVELLIEHRHRRAREVEACLRDGLDTIPAMVKRMYHDLPAGMHPAATRSVLATIIHLVEQGVVTCGRVSGGRGALHARGCIGHRLRCLAGHIGVMTATTFDPLAVRGIEPQR